MAVPRGCSKVAPFLVFASFFLKPKPNMFFLLFISLLYLFLSSANITYNVWLCYVHLWFVYLEDGSLRCNLGTECSQPSWHRGRTDTARKRGAPMQDPRVVAPQLGDGCVTCPSSLEDGH